MLGMQSIVIYPSRKKIFGLTVISIALAALSFFLGRSDWIIVLKPTATLLLLYGGAPFFGITTVYALFRLSVRKPLFVISDEGIRDGGSLINLSLITWLEIDRIFYQRTADKDYLCVALKKPEEFIKKQPRAKRFFLKKKARDAAFITIPEALLPISPGELINSIRAVHPEVRIHYPFPILGADQRGQNADQR